MFYFDIILEIPNNYNKKAKQLNFTSVSDLNALGSSQHHIL